ncbi:MAG: transcriptional regulator, AraC family [Rhodocyclaceae bacterium]|nr:transcriptional regulator, AraC family [Rhodocyclaceae bacterium]
MISTPRLDRLSALLEGLAPRVEVVDPAIQAGGIRIEASSGSFLHIYLVVTGFVRLRLSDATAMGIGAPAIVVCRADVGHSLRIEDSMAPASVMGAKAFMDGPVAALFLGEFAAPLVVSLDAADSLLGHVVGLISSELLDPRCGQPALFNRAGDILFIGLLRQLVAHPRTQDGLFNGLADPRIARALVAMHTSPQRDWTLERLADEAGMSRTSFAVRFRDVMRTSPGKYLGRLRLLIARRVVESGLGLKRAARESGYASPAALSRALSRAAQQGASLPETQGVEEVDGVVAAGPPHHR